MTTTNEDILKFLNNRRVQANENTQKLREEMRDRKEDLNRKVDGVKNDSIKKEK